MKCEDVRKLLGEYRTDALGSRKRREMQRHIETCEACRQELDAFDSVMDVVASNIPDHEPPEGLWNGVYNRITAPETKPGLLDRVRDSVLRKPLRLAGAGAAVAALVVGLILGTVHDTGPGEQLALSAPDNTYVQAHAYTASRAPLANHVSYVSIVATAEQAEAEHSQ